MANFQRQCGVERPPSESATDYIAGQRDSRPIAQSTHWLDSTEHPRPSPPGGIGEGLRCGAVQIKPARLVPLLRVMSEPPLNSWTGGVGFVDKQAVSAGAMQQVAKDADATINSML